MAEISLPWSGTITGDAGPYSDDDWSDMYRKLFTIDRTTQGVLLHYENEIEITGGTSPISINTGAAIVDGKFYENDSSANIVVPTPAVSTRIDRIVLRKSWTAQTVRMTRIEGIEGGGVPALTQNDGTTWDIPLYQVSITTGGNITLTDERSYPALAGADIWNGDIAITAGANSGAETRIDAANKLMRMGLPHYTNAEELFGLLYAFITNTDSHLKIGGDSSQMNCATAVIIVAAADTTTVTGTDVVTITTDGIGFMKVPANPIDLNLPTEDLEIVDAGSAAATEQDWIEVEVGGNQGYIRVYAAK